MSEERFTQYEIVKDAEGYTVTHDGLDYGTGLSKRDAQDRIWLLQRIGEAYNLLSEVHETIAELGDPGTYDRESYDIAGLVAEVVWDFEEFVQGKGDKTGPLHYLLNGPPVRTSRRRGGHR